MCINHSPAPVEFLENRSEKRIAEPFVAVAREHANALGLEYIEAVLDLAQAAFDIRQRQRDEDAEAARMIRSQARRLVVAATRETPGYRVIPEPHTRRRYRRDRRGYAGPVHVFDGFSSRPA